MARLLMAAPAAQAACQRSAAHGVTAAGAAGNLPR
jgi:hypothetical protein